MSYIINKNTQGNGEEFHLWGTVFFMVTPVTKRRPQFRERGFARREGSKNKAFSSPQ